MKVKIVRSTYQTMWYADKIGEVFEVENWTYDEDYKVKHYDWFIKKIDCVVVQKRIEGVE